MSVPTRLSEEASSYHAGMALLDVAPHKMGNTTQRHGPSAASITVSTCPRVPDSKSLRAQGGKKQRAENLERREKAMCTKVKRNNDGQGGKAIPQLPPDRSLSSGPIDMSEAQDFAILRIPMLAMFGCLLSIFPVAGLVPLLLFLPRIRPSPARPLS
jgi:hypothetical protein